MTGQLTAKVYRIFMQQDASLLLP